MSRVAGYNRKIAARFLKLFKAVFYVGQGIKLAFSEDISGPVRNEGVVIDDCGYMLLIC